MKPEQILSAFLEKGGVIETKTSIPEERKHSHFLLLFSSEKKSLTPIQEAPPGLPILYAKHFAHKDVYGLLDGETDATFSDQTFKLGVIEIGKWCQLSQAQLAAFQEM